MRGGLKVFVSGAALAGVAIIGTLTTAAQQPTNQTPATPAAAAPQEKKPPTFPLPEKCQDCDVALVQFLIKSDRTADFELVLNKVKEALAKSDVPERKQQASGWTVFRSGAPGPKQKVGDAMVDTVLYIVRIDPIVKGAEYDLMRLIAEVFPTEAQEIFPKYRDAFAGRGLTELKRVMTMQ